MAVKSDFNVEFEKRTNPVEIFQWNLISDIRKNYIEVVNIREKKEIKNLLFLTCGPLYTKVIDTDNSIFFKNKRNKFEILGIFEPGKSTVSTAYINLKDKEVLPYPSIKELELYIDIDKKREQYKDLLKRLEKKLSSDSYFKEIQLFKEKSKIYSLGASDIVELQYMEKSLQHSIAEGNFEEFCIKISNKLLRSSQLWNLLDDSNYLLMDFSELLEITDRGSGGISKFFGNIWLKCCDCGGIFKLTSENTSFFKTFKCKVCYSGSVDELGLKKIFTKMDGLIDRNFEKIDTICWEYCFYVNEGEKRKNMKCDCFIKTRDGLNIFLEHQGSQHITDKEQIQKDKTRSLCIKESYPENTKIIYSCPAFFLRELNKSLGSSKILKDIYEDKSLNIKFIDLDDLKRAMKEDEENAFKELERLFFKR